MTSRENRATIRTATAEDHDGIRAVVAAAFASAVEAALVDRIRASPEYIPSAELVASVDGAIVGHVMISAATLRNDAGDRQIAMLSPLSVAPDHQRLGIGGDLVRAVTERAEQAGEPLVILEGSPRYYYRFGFEHSVPHGIHIHLPDWAPAEAAQVMLLRAYDPTDPTLRGTVIYPAAFDDLG